MFFIIFGFDTYTRIIGTVREIYKCENCNNEIIRNIIRVRKWFSLFWIPCIPYSSKYYVVCPTCEYGYEINKPNITKESETIE